MVESYVTAGDTARLKHETERNYEISQTVCALQSKARQGKDGVPSEPCALASIT